MASYDELSFDWNFLFDQQLEFDKWSKADLQLAAELGKTLLERNKELEILLKDHKSTIEEQEQEIVYLKKHTTALREVNDSRLKVYEQLEVGIQDLERANHRLLVENTSDKKHIKTLVHNIETLETRNDELNKQLEETRQTLSMERRKNERLMQEKNGNSNNEVHLKSVLDKSDDSTFDSIDGGFKANTSPPENCSFAFETSNQRKNANSTGINEADIKNIDMVDEENMACGNEDNEEIIKLVNILESTRKTLIAEQQRSAELEEQIVAIIQENQTLQSRIAQTSANEEMRSMHEELSNLDEVIQGQMCSRCFRAVEDRATINDEQSSIAPTEEGDDDEEQSLLGLDNASENSQIISLHRTNAPIKISGRAPDLLDLPPPASPNPYRDLVEKYEALLEVQRSSIARKSSNDLSLADEFKSTSNDFNQTQKLMNEVAAAAAVGISNVGNFYASSNGDNASSCNGSMSNDVMPNKTAKNVRGEGVGGRGGEGGGRTPTEFSEAETLSSGFSDETSNKCTQTDDRPGYFLCSIGDGEDCKFSIYDDASSIDSRFRNRPEYRELFKEIFAVLKKAAENKEEGDKLPLLDDTHPNAIAGAVGLSGVGVGGGGGGGAGCIGIGIGGVGVGGSGGDGVVAKVPPVTPANEELPVDFGDDTQSIISSAISEQSFAMSECITKLERKTAKKHIIEKNQENKPPSMVNSITQLATVSNTKPIVENGRVLTPLKREPLEYLTVNVGIKKKNRKKNRNFGSDRSESPVALPSPPRFFISSGKKRKDVRPFVESPMATTTEQQQQQPGSSGRYSRQPRGNVAGGAGVGVNGAAGSSKFEWNGTSMVIYNRTVNSPQHNNANNGRGRELDFNSFEYRPSTVSQDLHKLKKLDLSYAEVLRRADVCKSHNHHQQHQTSQQRRRNHHH